MGTSDSSAEGGAGMYKAGYRDGWEAATNFIAMCIHALMKQLPLYVDAYEPAIDDADKHVVTLERWREDASAAHTAPPVPVRSV